ncbi:phage tail tape measure protein [Cryobacterium sp. HLT2-28]|nr:phage tail tape measure protein [Cryobacterium sp. HLT2-28]
MAATALKTFNLKGSDMNHVADLMAAGAGKAMGDVTDLSGALSQAGLVANSTGLSIEETTGTLSAFAAKGLLGSDAGTAFKSMLQRLTPQSAEAAAKMDELGISAYDAQGNFIGMEKFAGNLATSMKDLSVEQRNAAMSTIFGSDAVRASTVLFDEGAAGIKKYIDQTNDSGYAAKVAADRLDNLRGDVEALGGSFDTYLIQSGSGANDVLRTLTQGATGLVTAAGALPEPVLGGALALGGLVAAVALAGGTALVAIPKIAAFKASLTDLGISGGSAARGVGLLSGGLAIAGIALAVFADNQAKATERAKSYEDSLDSLTGKTTDYSREIAKANLVKKGNFLGIESDSAYDAAKKIGLGLDVLTDAALGSAPALAEVQKHMQAFTDLVNSGNDVKAAEKLGLTSQEYAAAVKVLRDSIGAETSGVIAGQKAWAQKAEATDGAAGSLDAIVFSYGNSEDAAAALDDQIRSLTDSMNKQNGVNQDAAGANADYQQSIFDLSEYVRQAKGGADGFSTSLDANTVEGSKNVDMLAGHAKAAQDSAKATLDADGNMNTYRATLQAGWQTVYDSALALTGNADAAKAIADNLAAIPAETAFKVIADTSEAARRLEHLRDLIRTIPGSIALGPGVQLPNPLDVYNRATGGILPGAPSSKDNMFIHAASGEFVTRASQTAIPANRAALEYMNRGGTIRGYASGGLVGYAAPIQYAAPNGGCNHVSNANSTQQSAPNINITAPAIATPDSLVYATILGRELGRTLSGKI